MTTDCHAHDQLIALRQSLLNGPTHRPNRAAITGGTPMALGLAVSLARIGCEVDLIEADAYDAQRMQDALLRAPERELITVSTDLDRLRHARLVAAASGDNSGAQLSTLVAATPADVPLITLGSQTAPGSDALACIPVAPPPNIGVMEVMPGAQTSQATLDHCAAIFRAMGIAPLITKTPLSPRLIARLEDCAEALIFDGSTPWDYDEALEQFGFAPPPCAAQDLRGLDLAFARHRAEDRNGTRANPCPALDRMVPEGRLGRVGGVGWYRYPGGGGRVIDPLVEDLVREEAHFAGHTLRNDSADDLRKLTLLALIDTAADLLASGAQPTHIDLISVEALGFPHQLGGLSHFASTYGFQRAAGELAEIAQHRGAFWRPSAALLARAQA